MQLFEELDDLFCVTLKSKSGGLREVYFNSKYKSTDSGQTTTYDKDYLKSIKITFDDKIDLERALKAILDNIDKF